MLGGLPTKKPFYLSGGPVQIAFRTFQLAFRCHNFFEPLGCFESFLRRLPHHGYSPIGGRPNACGDDDLVAEFRDQIATPGTMECMVIAKTGRRRRRTNGHSR